MTDAALTALQTADWRRRTFALYSAVRATTAAEGPATAHARWVAGRDELFGSHPASPLLPEDRDGFAGLPVAPYDPAWRFEAQIVPTAEARRWDVETGTDGTVPFELLGEASVPGVGSLEVWRLASYGGGLFVPVKDALAGRPGGSYGGGRYLIDTVKGAWLGGTGAGADAGATDPAETGTGPGTEPGGGAASLVLDFNFAYNPSCAYDPAWACPLAPAGDTIAVPIPVGERMP